MKASVLRSILIALVLLLTGTTATFAQYVEYGTDPASLRWHRIQSTHFDVIFPDSARAMAEHFHRLLNRIYLPNARSLGHAPRSIPVIMHSVNLRSNGMVVWVPSRMEIIAAAPPNGEAQPWLEHLALHEFRHVVQTDMLNRGFTRGLYFLLGEQAVALPAALIKPWLLEGDAVMMETALSHAGRGRQPSFDMGLRTISQSGARYSYDKLLLGSFRNYIPNHYEYGYHIAAYGRYRYGETLWAQVFRYTGSYPFTIFPQAFATKKYTGRFPKTMHREAMQCLDSLWSKQVPERVTASRQMVDYGARTWLNSYVSFRYPMLTKCGLMAYRSSLADIPQLVRIDEMGRVHSVKNVGNLSSKMAYNAGCIYWTEHSSDLRWEQRSHSELWRYSVPTNELKRITRRTAYFAPAVCCNGAVAVCEKLPSGKQRVLIVIDTNAAVLDTPRIIAEHPFETNISDLAWIGHDTLATLYTTPNGIRIDITDIRSRKSGTLLPPTSSEISSIAADAQHVYFSSGYDGVNNIYAVNISNHAVFKLTQARFGAFDPQPVSVENIPALLYTDYTASGYNIALAQRDSLLWQPTSFDAPYSFPLAENLARQEQFLLDTATLDTAPILAKRYYKFPHLLRIHSWAPFAYNPQSLMQGDLTNIAVGATIISQNNLGSMVASASLINAEGYTSVRASATFRGWFPMIDFSGNYGARPRYEYHVGQGSTRRGGRYGEVNAQVYVPLNLSRGALQASLTPYLHASWSNDLVRRYASEAAHSLCGSGIGFQLRLTSLSAARDINPRRGLILSAGINGFLNVGFVSHVNTTLYLRGLMPNNSVRLSAGYEMQNESLVVSSSLALPRGFAAPALAAPRVAAYSASYALPLWYPDIALGGLAYIKRVRLNLFADYRAMNSATDLDGIEQLKKMCAPDAHFGSCGYEAVVDLHAFRWPFLFSIGWRQSFMQYAMPITTSYVPQTLPIELMVSVSY